MNNWFKNIFIAFAFFMILAVGLYIFITIEWTIYSTTSPDGKHIVSVKQERGKPFFNRKHVYLYAKSGSAPVLVKQRIMSSHMMEGNFMDHYPDYAWIRKDVLMIGNNVKESKSKLKVKNKGKNKLSYVLLETKEDKFIIFDMKPNSQIELGLFPMRSMTVQARYEGTDKSFGNGVMLESSILDVPKDLEYDVLVKNRNIDIVTPGYEVEFMGCCGYGRREIP